MSKASAVVVAPFTCGIEKYTATLPNSDHRIVVGNLEPLNPERIRPSLKCVVAHHSEGFAEMNVLTLWGSHRYTPLILIQYSQAARVFRIPHTIYNGLRKYQCRREENRGRQVLWGHAVQLVFGLLSFILNNKKLLAGSEVPSSLAAILRTLITHTLGIA